MAHEAEGKSVPVDCDGVCILVRDLRFWPFRLPKEFVSLYDDSEKLIESRFLKEDELVECGGMLTFENHLVDIGDLDGICKSQTDLKVSRKDKKTNENTSDVKQNSRREFSLVHKRNESGCCRGTDGYPNVARPSIKENNKTALQSSGRPRSPPNSAQTTFKEWNALYTAQITQKAKKYHDGILRLAVCGSHMSQVMLLNENRAVLSSKYLKSAECLRTGHTFEMPNYVVEICELQLPQGEFSQLSENKKTELHKSGRPENHPNSSNIREWNTLYTTQMTQKAKRYHDGVLRLADCGSHMNQIILLNEEGAVLCSEHLKSVECVRTGSTYKMPNYLIEICEPRSLQGGAEKFSRVSSPRKVVTNRSFTDVSTSNADVLRNKPILDVCLDAAEESIKDSYSNKVGATNSLKEELISSTDVLKTKPFRDAFQILSILKKPSPEGSLVSRKSVGCNQPSLPPESLLSDVQGINVLVDPDDHGKSESDKFSASSAPLRGRNQNDFIRQANASECQVDNDGPGPRPGPGPAQAPTNSMSRRVYVEEYLGSSSLEGKEQLGNAPTNLLNGNICADDEFSTASFDNSMQTTEAVKDKYSDQVHADYTKAEKEESNEAVSWAASILSCHPESAVTYSKIHISEEFGLLSEKTMDPDEFPTFDLGI